MAEITLKDINSTLQKQGTVNKDTNKHIKGISTSLSSFISMLVEDDKSEALKNREATIEGGAKPTAAAAAVGAAGGAGLFAGLIPSLGTLALGAIGAFLASYDEFMNHLSRTFAAFFTGIPQAIGRRLAAFAKLFHYDGAIGKLLKFDNLYIYFDDIAKSIKNTFMGEKTLFGAIGRFFKNTFGNEESILGKMFAKIKSAFTIAEDSPIMKIVGKFGGVFKTLGFILKKIFIPIGLIFTAYDTVKGIIEGYEEAGIVGGIVGGVTGFFKSVVGAPLNLLRDASAFILEKLGFKETAKWIKKNFDFEKLFDDIGEGLIKFINSPIDTIKGWLTSIFGKGTSEEARQKNLEDNPSIAELNEAIPMNNGTQGAFGKLFKDFGSGTLAMLHGNEAVVPENSEMGGFLSKIMDASAPMAQFGHAQGQKMKAKENAMRAAGASDMEIAQSMMGDMGGMMSGLKGAVSAGGLDKLKAPKMDMSGVKDMMSPSNLGNMFGGMVRDSEENKRVQARQAAPVIISDNSTKSTGVSNTAMPIQSQPFDFHDPVMSGFARV